MIPWNREGMAVVHHPHREPQNPGRVGSTVNEVTEEHNLSTSRVCGIHRAALVIPLDLVSKVPEKRFEL